MVNNIPLSLSFSLVFLLFLFFQDSNDHQPFNSVQLNQLFKDVMLLHNHNLVLVKQLSFLLVFYKVLIPLQMKLKH